MTVDPHNPPRTTSRPPEDVRRTRDASAAQQAPPRPNPAHAGGNWGAPPPPGVGAGRVRYDGAGEVPLNGTVARLPQQAQPELPLAGSGHNIVLQPAAVYNNSIVLSHPRASVSPSC